MLSVKQFKMKKKKTKSGFLEMLLGTLGATLLGNPLTGKWVIRMKTQLELVKMFDSACSFNYFWNKKVLSKWTKI